MSYALVTLFLYLYRFVPEVFSRPLLVIPLISAFIVLTLRNRNLPIYLLSALTAFLLLVEAPGNAEIGADRSTISVLYGKALQDSSGKEGRRSGFRMELSAAGDESGALFSASGSLYVSANSSDVRFGERISVLGAFSGPVFIASGVTELGGSRLHDIRNAVADSIKSRLRIHGEAGELGMRLLLGYGEMGVFSLSSDASASGLMHVLALSGMHLSILSSMLSSLLFMVNARRRSFAICIFLIFFSFLSGWRPSLVRALIFRFSIAYSKDRDLAFLLSFLFLQIIFPYSCTDLGSVYSFISLAGIFMLSEPIDRAFRLFLPLSKSFSLSAAASVSALLLSVPLTMDVFGCYQLGTVLSSFPASMMISLYMGLSIIAAVFPFSGCFLRIAYEAVELIFRVSALFPRSEDLTGYAVLLLLSVLLIAIDIAYRIFSGKYVEPELQQHK